MTCPELRAQVLERDNFTCQRCKCTNKKLSTHHKIALRYGGMDSLDNIITYCNKCHKIIEPSRKMGPITSLLYRYLGGSSIRVSMKMKSRLARIGARLTLKDGKTRSMEELLELLADAYDEKEAEK
jgi:HNH endonuclease